VQRPPDRPVVNQQSQRGNVAVQSPRSPPPAPQARGPAQPGGAPAQQPAGPQRQGGPRPGNEQHPEERGRGP